MDDAPSAGAGTMPSPAAKASSDELRAWVVSFYEAHNPEKLASVDSILAKFSGKEQELVRQLERKYLVSPAKEMEDALRAAQKQLECERKELGRLRRELEAKSMALERERRSKDEGMRQLGERTAALALQQQRSAGLEQLARREERRAAAAVADSAAANATASAALAQLAEVVEARRELAAHLSSALDRLAAEKVEPSTGAETYETLYRSASYELGMRGSELAQAEQRIVELSKRCRLLEDEATELRRSFDLASGDVRDAEKSVELANTQKRSALDQLAASQAALDVQHAETQLCQAKLRDAEAALDAAYTARRLLEDHFYRQRNLLEAAASERVNAASETYNMLQADLLSRDANLDDLHRQTQDQRLTAAIDEADRLSRALVDLKADKDAIKRDADRLRSELKKAAQRILQAENLLSTQPRRNRHNEPPLESDTTCETLKPASAAPHDADAGQRPHDRSIGSQGYGSSSALESDEHYVREVATCLVSAPYTHAGGDVCPGNCMIPNDPQYTSNQRCDDAFDIAPGVIPGTPCRPAALS